MSIKKEILNVATLESTKTRKMLKFWTKNSLILMDQVALLIIHFLPGKKSHWLQ